MPLSEETAKDLVKKIEKRQIDKEINWQSVAGGNRRIVYIPFTAGQDPATPPKQTMRETKEDERKALMLRSFAKTMQKIMDEGKPEEAVERMKIAVGPGGKLKSDNLMKVFESIKDDELEKEILRKTAAKTPIIIQQGQPLPAGFRIEGNDAIEIAGHGRKLEDIIQNAGTKMDAKQVLTAMQGTFGDQMQNIRSIKLTSCGSGDKFFNSFAGAVKTQDCGLSGDIKLDGYAGEAFMIPKIEHALDHLDMGNRFVSSAADLKTLRTLKGLRSAVNLTVEELDNEKVAWSNANDPDADREYVEVEGDSVVDEESETPEMKQKRAAYADEIKKYNDEIDLYSAVKNCLNEDIEDHTFNGKKFIRASADGSRERQTIKTVRDSLFGPSPQPESQPAIGHKTGGSSSSSQRV